MNHTQIHRKRNIPVVSPPRRSRMYSSDRECAALTASVTAALTASAPSYSSSGAIVTEMGVCCPVRTTLTLPSRAVASISVYTEPRSTRSRGSSGMVCGNEEKNKTQRTCWSSRWQWVDQ